jgi:hypothetical protein
MEELMNVVQQYYNANAEKEWERLTFERQPHRWLEVCSTSAGGWLRTQ